MKCRRRQRLVRITVEKDNPIVLVIGGKRYRGCPEAFDCSGRGLERQLEQFGHEVHAIAAADGTNILGSEKGWEASDLFGRGISSVWAVRNEIPVTGQQEGNATIPETLDKEPGNVPEYVRDIQTAYKRLMDTIGEGYAFKPLEQPTMSLNHIIAEDIYLAGLNSALSVDIVDQTAKSGVPCCVHPMSPKKQGTIALLIGNRPDRAAGSDNRGAIRVGL